jgi:hypothetical protein
VEGPASHQETWRRRAERYERRYYSTLRSVVARYATISEVFPHDFHKPTRSLLVYCSDGLILLRFVAEKDSFEFESARGETVFDAARRLRAGDLKFKAPRASRWFLEFRNFKVEIRPDGSDEVITITPEWHSFAASRGYSNWLWSEEAAEGRARWDALLYVAAPALGIESEELSARPNVPSQAYSAFEAVTMGFQELIQSSDREAPLQEYLTQHPALLTLEAARVYPKLKLGDDYITDFVMELGDQQYVLVEIEAATRPLYTKGGYPASELNYAIQQVEDWLQWVEDSAEYILAKLPAIAHPQCWEIVGRRLEDKKREAKWKRKRGTHAKSGIAFMTYDGVRDKDRRQLASLRRLEGVG